MRISDCLGSMDHEFKKGEEQFTFIGGDRSRLSRSGPKPRRSRCERCCGHLVGIELSRRIHCLGREPITRSDLRSVVYAHLNDVVVPVPSLGIDVVESREVACQHRYETHLLPAV
jgi:hypothetical protein